MTADRDTGQEAIAQIGREVRHAQQTKWPAGDSWIRGYVEDFSFLLGLVSALEQELADTKRELDAAFVSNGRLISKMGVDLVLENVGLEARITELEAERDELKARTPYWSPGDTGWIECHSTAADAMRVSEGSTDAATAADAAEAEVRQLREALYRIEGEGYPGETPDWLLIARSALAAGSVPADTTGKDTTDEQRPWVPEVIDGRCHQKQEDGSWIVCRCSSKDPCDFNGGPAALSEGETA